MVSNEKEYISYWDIFKERIIPKLQEIDIAVKSIEDGMEPEDAAEILDMSIEELTYMMDVLNITEINRQAFFKLMSQGKSQVCRLYQREVACGSPLAYTKEQVAFIYDLDMDLVCHVCDALRIKEVTSYTLPNVLGNIPYKVNLFLKSH